MKRPSLVVACAALLAQLGLPLTAQTPTAASTHPLRTADALYMGQGLVLVAKPPRQLTLNANVRQFLFQPGGDSLAYVSDQGYGDAQTYTVKFVDGHAKNPDTQTIFQADKEIELGGWSPDGRYLFMAREYNDFLCGDVGSDPFAARPIPLPEQSPSGDHYTPVEFAWSPNGHSLLFVQYTMFSIEKHQAFHGLSPTPPAFTLYEPARGTEQTITPGEGLDIKGWLDEGHLLTVKPAPAKGQAPVYHRYDLATGAETEIALPKPWPRSPDNALSFSHLPRNAMVSPSNPDLALELQAHWLPDTRQAVATSANSLWVRNGKAPKTAAVLAVAVTPGKDDPQVQWSPDGNAVAYVAHGDLFISTLAEREATPRERLAAGEPLDCAEERQLAVDNLKQIGLAMMQYTLDENGHYPSNSDLQDKVGPYLADDSVFQLGKVPFVYHEPANLSVAAIEDPTSTALGSIDLPCARVVLYVDGHVKEFMKNMGGADTPSTNDLGGNR